MATAPVTQIGKYRVLELLGEGAMGIVYRAEDTVLGRVVAVKVMSDAIAREDELRGRFLREAQAAGSLQHPNVVTIYDFGETDGHLYIAMEYVDGEDLETVIAARQPLTLDATLGVIIDLLTGLAYAHRRGIVHRDIKPGNIRIAEDGRAKIMDFGVVHLDSSSMTRTGMMMGTPSYMAPEQVTGGRVSPATDIFAAGTVLYELLTGRKPFDGPTLHSILFRIVSAEPPDVLAVVPSLPPALGRIVHRALAKEMTARYQSALEMANELSVVRAGLSGSAESGTLSLRARLATPAAARIARPGSVVPHTQHVLQWAGGALAAAAAVATIWTAVAQHRGPDAGPAGGSASAAVMPMRPATAPLTASPAPGTASRALANRGTADAGPRQRPPAPAPATPRQTGAVATAPPHRPAATPGSTAPTRDVNAAPATASDVPAASTVVHPAAPVPVALVTRAPLPSAGPGAPPAAAPPAAAPPATPVPSPAVGVGQAIAAYARAIESRDIAAIRRVYPGLTAVQQRGFEQFFSAARTLHVTFTVVRLDVSGPAANARTAGTYEYTSSDGRPQRQPVTFRATLQRDGAAWRLLAVQ